MRDLAESINEGMDAREVKRAVSVKMGRQGLSSAQICQVLNVSPQYVSKWKGRDEVEGAASLRLGYGGSERDLSGEHNGQRLPSGAQGRSGVTNSNTQAGRRCWPRCEG